MRLRNKDQSSASRLCNLLGLDDRDDRLFLQSLQRLLLFVTTINNKYDCF